MTPEERRQINRKNAQSSTGPRSEQGKANSRRNALKHGLCATDLALSNEDRAEVEARYQSWNDFFQPRNPVAQHLVNQCVQATLLSDRCQRHHTTALAKQVREAEELWDRARFDELETLKAQFAHEPRVAVRLLKRSSLGCGWLLERWEELGAILDARGQWDPAELDEALRLLGREPEPHSDQAAHLDPAILRSMLAEQRTMLQREAVRLWRDLEAPDRAEAADRSLMLRDFREAGLFLRYHAESRTAFARTYKQLTQALALGEFHEPEPADDDSRNEANLEAVAPVMPVSRNEANLEAAVPVVPVSRNEAKPVVAPVASVSRNEAKPVVAPVASVSRNEAKPVAVPVASVSRNEAKPVAVPVTSVSRNEANLEANRSQRTLSGWKTERFASAFRAEDERSGFGGDGTPSELVGVAVLI